MTDSQEDVTKKKRDTEKRIMSFLITNVDIKLMDDFAGLSDLREGSESSSSSSSSPSPSKSPVIRILGSASSGQSSCVYVHGVIPYMYFRPVDLYDELFADYEWISGNLELMREKIEDAVKTQKKNQGWTKVKPSIWKMEIVNRKSLYGYYADVVYFVKVYCKQYNDVQKICTLLTDVGIFGNNAMQCYEAHIPPLLQFLQDYNLYGMNWMHVSSLTWRRPLPPSVGSSDDDDDDDDSMDYMYKQVTEATAYKWNVWDKESDIEGDSDNNYEELSPSELLQRALGQQPAHITDGLTPSFFDSQISDKEGQSSIKQPINRLIYDVRKPKFPVKTSCCELEADIHCSAIMNARELDNSTSTNVSSQSSGSKTERTSSMSDYTLPSHVMKMNHIRSLTALWDEERARRIRKGFPLDEFNTPPFTDSTYRTLGDCEVEYRNRFDALVSKGILLKNILKEPESDYDQIARRDSSCVMNHNDHDDYIDLHPTQFLPRTMKSQIVMTAMDDPNTLALNLGQHTLANPFEQDHHSDNDDDDDNIDEENEQEMEQQIINSMKEKGEVLISRDDPRYREERSLVQTQRDNANIISLSQNDGIEEVEEKTGIDSPNSWNKNEVSEKKDVLLDDVDEIFDHSFKVSLPPSKPPIAAFSSNHPTASQSRGKSFMTDVLSLSGGVGKSSRRESKRSQSQSEKCYQQLEDDKKSTDVVERRTKRPKNVTSYHFKNSPESPLAQQGLASCVRSSSSTQVAFSSEPSLSQQSSQSGRHLSPYSRKLLEVSNILQQALYASLHLAPTYKPPSYNSVLMENTRAPSKPVMYLDKRSKDSKLFNQSTIRHSINLNYDKNRCLVPTFFPPSFQEVNQSMEMRSLKKNQGNKPRMISQVANPTQTTDSNDSSDLFNMKRTDSTQKQNKKNKHEYRNRSKITSMSVELFCNSVNNFIPNPDQDVVFAFAWVADVRISDSENEETNRRSGLVVCPQIALLSTTGQSYDYSKFREELIFKSSSLSESVEFLVVVSELALFDALIELVTVQIDPDFLLAYEVQKASFGYLEARGKFLGLDILHMLGRFPFEPPDKRNETNNEFNKYAEDHDSGIWISGRSVLNLWRVMSGELKLQSFDLGYVVEQVLNRRMPHYSNRLLKKWFKDDNRRGRVYDYLYQLTEVNMRLMDKLDILRRTSEYARLYGIDFYSVLTRGSQFRVEACLIRIAHSQGYIAASGTKLQVSRQAGLECQPLVMEPESGFYEDPIVVLDFQSLYPSMMIAYNLCYTTIIGKMRRGTHGSITTGQLGFTPYSEDLSAENAQKFHEDAYLAPNGSAFCPVTHREGILPMMLKELLATRQMIKRSMKMYKNENASSVLHRVLDARQHALKMLSNVTYGYTTSSFSGRMPMAELADAIVECGRSTLMWTKRLIERDKSWKARVVYGDTDSVFVLLKGRTKDEAFAIGEEIANMVTSLSPAAVVLKLEKVYTRSILVTKKRYVGFSYESPRQEKGSYDAKGIETQRRDNIPATQKLQEKCIRLYFTTLDINAVREYLIAQWTKIQIGVSTKLTIQDFIFNKAVKWGKYKSDSSSPPGAIVSLKKIADGDKMAEPPYGWRVPYVVVWGQPGAILRDLVVPPEVVLSRGNDLSINHTYYITKVINPALDRVFRLCGVDIKEWYLSTPRPKKRLRLYHYHPEKFHVAGKGTKPKGSGGPKQQSITGFCKSTVCEGCGKDSNTYLCIRCAEDGDVNSSVVLQLNQVSKKERALSLICQNCSKVSQLAVIGVNGKGEMTGPENCSSLACSVFFERCRLILRIEDLEVAVHDAESSRRGNDNSSNSRDEYDSVFMNHDAINW